MVILIIYVQNRKLVFCRFVLIFPALPDNATEFDFIVPSSVWQFKDIKCK